MRSRAAFVLSVALVGCASSAQSPQSALHDYARALEDGRADDAYRLLSAEARRGVSRQQFTTMLRENPDEAKELGRALQRSSLPAVVTARVTTQSGHEVDLVLENGRWVLDGSAVDLYAQDTPRHAVQSFVRAVERKRYDVVLRFVPLSHREGISAKLIQESWEGTEKNELLATLVAIKQALPTASIEQTGDHAAMSYGSGSLSLLRENGTWKIEDFN